MNYHLSRNGQPTGTCSKEEAIARYARGEILPTDLVWCEGMANWAAASQVFGTPSPTSPMPPPVSTPPPVAGVAPLPRPVAARAVSDAGKPQNYLVFSILATLLCCLPGGIVAIIYSTQVDSKWALGDQAGADAAAKNARLWCIISAATPLIGLLVYLGVVLVMMMLAGAGAAMQ